MLLLFFFSIKHYGNLFCFRMQMKESTKSSRLSQQLDRAITTVFKPVANHNFNVSSREEESGGCSCVRL